MKRLGLLVTIALLLLTLPPNHSSAQPPNYLYITNLGTATLSVVDLSSTQVVATLPVGSGPFGVALAPDGARAYVASSSDHTINVIDTTSLTVVDIIFLGAAPYRIALAPDGMRAYVTSIYSHVVTVIDLIYNRVITTVNVGATPQDIALKPDGTRAYVVNQGSDTVSILDTATNREIATVSVGSGPSAIAVAPDGSHAYVTNSNANTISVIDLSSQSVVTVLPIGSVPVGITLTPDGSQAYVVNQGAGTVSVLDLISNTLVATVPVGLVPLAIVITPDGTSAYVGNRGDGTVSVIDTASKSVIATLSDFRSPHGLAIGSGTSLPPAFPNSSVLDTFNRANGALGAAWSGSSTSGFYQIVANQVKVIHDGPLYWQAGNPFGVDQEVFVTLGQVDTQGQEHDLLLKVQGGSSPDWQQGVIEVLYDAAANNGSGAVRVETFGPHLWHWTSYPNLAVTFVAGDQFGAQALASGEVRIYKNGQLVGSQTLNAADQAFFNSKGGRIGLWFMAARSAIFDDVGGGTIVP